MDIDLRRFVRLAGLCMVLVSGGTAAAASSGGWTEVAHTLDYLAYAHLQRAEDVTATGFVAELVALGNQHRDDYGVLEHVADIKARSLIERQAWSEYDSVDLQPSLGRR